MRILALAVSFAIHAAIAWNMGDLPLSGREKTQNHVVTAKVSFKKILPPPPKKQCEVEPPKIKPKPKKKPVKTARKHTPKPKPKPNPAPAPEPEPEPVIEPEPVEAKTPEPPPVLAAAQAPPVDRDRLKRERDEYLMMALARIEKEKYYPRAARRRGIQAAIKVRFTIMKSGGVENIRVEGSHAILERAAREALVKASPFPSPPESQTGPMNVEYEMEFALR